MWIKVVVIIVMLLILFSLFRGLFFLGKGGKGSDKKVLKSLKLRIGLTMLLFAVIILLHYFDVIQLRGSLLPVETISTEIAPTDQNQITIELDKKPS